MANDEALSDQETIVFFRKEKIGLAGEWVGFIENDLESAYIASQLENFSGFDTLPYDLTADVRGVVEEAMIVADYTERYTEGLRLSEIIAEESDELSEEEETELNDLEITSQEISDSINDGDDTNAINEDDLTDLLQEEADSRRPFSGEASSRETADDTALDDASNNASDTFLGLATETSIGLSEKDQAILENLDDILTELQKTLTSFDERLKCLEATTHEILVRERKASLTQKDAPESVAATKKPASTARTSRTNRKEQLEKSSKDNTQK